MMREANQPAVIGRLVGSSASGRLTPNELRTWISNMEFAQNAQEFEWMLEQLGEARSVLEIGSRFGVSLYRIAQHLKAPSRLVAVDLPNVDDNVLESEHCLLARCDDIRAMGHDCSVIIGDSHDRAVVEAVRHLGPFDFCFIDGDHTEAGVRQDWENYGPMSKMVAFHDIVGGLPTCVNPLWNELRQKYQFTEYVGDGSYMGIGILLKDSHAT